VTTEPLPRDLQAAAGAQSARYALPLRVYVFGRPRTKGSLEPIGYRANGSVILGEQVRGSKAWRGVMAETVLRTLGAEFVPGGFQGWWEPYPGAVAVYATVFLPRGERVEPWPIRRTDGDQDKYQRNIGDALQDTRVIADDSCIVHWDVWKRWAAPAQQTGVRIEVLAVEG
jgi:hypothetical protein